MVRSPENPSWWRFVLEVDGFKWHQSNIPLKTEATQTIVEGLPTRWGEVTQLIPRGDLLEYTRHVGPTR